MRRVIYGLLVIAALGAVWAVGGSVPAAVGAYRVTAQPDGTARLTLEVAHPGLFLDLGPGPIVAATVGTKESSPVSPWPGSNRQRFMTFFRGPVVVNIAQGNGPFNLAGLTAPRSGATPDSSLPDGWKVVGHYVGPLEIVQTQPFVVAAPVGMANTQAALERVNKFFRFAGADLQLPDPPGATVVLSGPTSLDSARAVADLWVPGLSPELDWWTAGVREWMAMRLMDRLKLWDDEDSAQEWMADPARGKGFRMAVWLDLCLGLDSHRTLGLYDIIRASNSLRKTSDLLALVKEQGSTSTWDTMDRMIKGREPWPSM